MIPHKTTRGSTALERMKVFEGIPAPFDKMKRMAEELDAHIFGIFGAHIIHWPKPIRDMCYNCKRLRPEALVAKTMDVEYDITGRIATLAVGGVMKMFGGVGKITDALKL
jgi:hypothetical protein